MKVGFSIRSRYLRLDATINPGIEADETPEPEQPTIVDGTHHEAHADTGLGFTGPGPKLGEAWEDSS